ncbi:MAG: hypothetical protein ACRD4Y_01180, partial [Candidatus Acidiferrales bacterium]
MNAMRALNSLVIAVLAVATPLAARGQTLKPVGALDQVMSKIVNQENREMAMIRSHSPLVET